MLCTANRTEPRSDRRAQETHTSLLVHTNDVYATRHVQRIRHVYVASLVIRR